jgi:uncharacterized protein
VAAGAIAYPVRHPRWSLTYAGANITADISAMVTEINYSDKVSHHSDELEVTLEDRDRRWQGPWFPTRGDVVTLQIGYDDGELMNCGDFQVDELELKGPPDTMHLKCIAAGITPSIRTPRSAAYESQTLIQVANTIAARQGITVTAGPQNLNVTWMRLTQRNETDLHFLRRLAQAHGYDFSIRGTQLVFYSRTALEAQAPVMTVTRGSSVPSPLPLPQQSGRGSALRAGLLAKSFEFKTRTQHIYGSASVAYQNPATKQLIVTSMQDASAPTGDDLHIVTRMENPQQAQLKVQSALHDANMLQVTGCVETEGTVLLVAGVNIGIQGFGNYDGTYHIQSSKHRLERSSGYTTEIQVRKLG